MKRTYVMAGIFIAVILLMAGFSYCWTSRSLAEKDSEISSLQGQIEDTQNFEKLLLKGIGYQKDALVNQGRADSEYDAFSMNYKDGYYLMAETHAKSAQIYYDYAVSGFENAKIYFEQARNCAPNDKYTHLIDNYIGVAEYGVKLYNEMSQASKYFASACKYYAQGSLEAGDEASSTANEHMATYDNWVSVYNEYLANTDDLLDDC
ncbi:MAG: hypothetical protein DRN83_02535 [Hadesarchaea archaeon]|nr:MAG: hypothetical protein DRN83_02535 [Hadesarchaea archaeon]